MAEVEWNADQLRAFARSLSSDKDGRRLKTQMQAEFDAITETLRDRLQQGLGELPGLGAYPSELAASVRFTTKLVGGKNARVSIVGEGKTRQGKWREVGKLLEEGFTFHPAWGRWLSVPPPQSLRMNVPEGPRMVTDVLDKSEPNIADEIRQVLTTYLDKLTEIRRA